VHIRNFEQSDLAAARALWVDLTERHRKIYNSPEIGGSDPGSNFDEHLEQVGRQNVWLAEAEGRAVGMVAMVSHETRAELEPIVVAPDWRGRGVGEALARVVLAAARARGDRQLITQPVARNERALRFFHGLGFDALGHLELIAQLTSPEEQVWRPGPVLAERRFRY
jgi:GNAT superfamily N-acetyltransferase